MATSKELRLENLRALVAEFKTAEAVAKQADTNAMYLSQILNGAKSSTGKARGVGDALARKLEAGCGKDEGWMDRPHGPAALMNLVPGAMPVRAVAPDDPSLTQIMKVKLTVQAGITGFQVEPEYYDGETQGVPTRWLLKEGLSRDTLLAITVKGESMEPALYDGDVIVVNTRDTSLADGSVYVVNYEGEAIVKRLQRDAGQWWLTSDNADQRKYHRKLCKGAECILIGKVIRKESTHI
ncbi:helix-turn-helix transcriptional regulator [Massilia sp. CMS3.1]|uniref:S24 family peptidase n=1 Tax=Massilia sp. CMS3.1 TaxID=3373083 RepID=UPI003EE5A211